jgi:hypothetical protein
LLYTSAIFRGLRQAIRSDNSTFSSAQHVPISLDELGMNANALECNFDMCLCD